MWTKSSYELYLTANSMPKILVITLCHEKTRKMKKAFCFDNCSCYNLRKNVSSSDFSFSQVTSVEEREPRGTFLSLGLRPRLQKTFPRFPFFYFGNLGKTKIVRGQIFPQSSTTNYRNKILFIQNFGDPIFLHHFFFFFFNL